MTRDDFSNLTVLSYTRGQLGEFFYLILTNKLNLLGNNVENFRTTSNNFDSYKVDMLLNVLASNQYISHWSIDFSKKLYGKNIQDLIRDKQYDLVRSFIDKTINIASFFDFDNVSFDSSGLNLEALLKLSYITDNNKLPIVTRSHCYYGENLSEVLPNVNHIRFYCTEQKLWIFHLLYFYKKYHSKAYLRNSWKIRSLDTFDQYFSYIISAYNGPIDNAENIDMFDCISNDVIPDTFNNQQTNHIILDNFAKNRELINQLGFDINDNVDIEDLRPTIFKWFKEVIDELD